MGGSSKTTGGGGGSGSGGKLLEILNVRVVGSGDRVVVFSHGFGTDQSAWNRVLPYFQRDYRVVLYDLVCAGSVNPDHFDFGRYKGLDAYVDDLLVILDALRIDRCFFVGHSVSAMIGIYAAIRRPDLFLKLVLIGASPSFSNFNLKVFERPGLPRGFREGGDRAGVRGDGGELQGVGDGVRAAGGGGGRAGGGAGVQPDAVQHAAGHLAVRVPDCLQQRPASRARPRPYPLRRRADGQGRLRASVRRHVPQGPPRRPHHRRATPH